MSKYQKKSIYITEWEHVFTNLNITEIPVLNEYILNCFKELEKCVEEMYSDKFWLLLPRIMGIDAKLSIIKSLMHVSSLNFFTDEEIISMVESDYTSYFKELCGYKLNETADLSLVFNVE